jgi:hypothetical protein
VKTHGQMQALPSKVTPKPLKEIPEAHELPKRKPGQTPPKKPTVDLEKVARERVLQTAQRIGRLNAWDARILASSAIAGVLSPFIGMKGGVELGASYLSSTLEKPKVLDWIAKTPPDELEALSKLPGIEKINVQHGLTQAVVSSANGKKLPVSTQLMKFLGPNNVKQLIVAGVVSNGPRAEKKPGEQINDLKRIQAGSNPNMPGGESER